ncbi:hypothetical protein [Sphingomonas metalli]|uniref:hypothetical protein n=1 Tax=Sphingomonas metalli TaxID=1779358 RepID=UPI00166CEAAF|nr:hypothetical protein [Sphingomonas metalli]
MTTVMEGVRVLGFSFGEVEGIVRAMHDVADEAGAIGSRFRYFQRLRFPEGANTGRGVPATYGLDQLMQVLVAFELSEAGMSPTRIVRTLRTNWARLRPVMRQGWAAGRGMAEWREREVLVLEPAALTDASRAEDAYVSVENPLVPMPAFALNGWAQGRDGPPRLLVIDPGRLVSELRRAFPIVTALTAEDLDEAFESYR